MQKTPCFPHKTEYLATKEPKCRRRRFFWLHEHTYGANTTTCYFKTGGKRRVREDLPRRIVAFHPPQIWTRMHEPPARTSADKDLTCLSAQPTLAMPARHKLFVLRHRHSRKLPLRISAIVGVSITQEPTPGPRSKGMELRHSRMMNFPVREETVINCDGKGYFLYPFGRRCLYPRGGGMYLHYPSPNRIQGDAIYPSPLCDRQPAIGDK